MDNDFYVINPSGFAELLEKTKNIPNLRLIDIWIRCDSDTLMKRAKRRDNYDDWFANFKKEEQEFMKFYPGVNYSYIVNNSGKLSDAIEEVQRIVQLEKYKDSLGYSPNLKAKELWIQKHLPFCKFIGVNSKEHFDKSSIDMSTGVLIDDNMKNLITSNALVNICYGDVYEWNKDWTGFRAKNWQDIKQFLMKGENKTIDDESRVSAAVT